MTMLDRYRKQGGFVQLLRLIETSPKEKQEKFLSAIDQESRTWGREVRKKMLTIERLLSWNPSYLNEVIVRMQPLHIAMIASSLPTDKNAEFMNNLSYNDRVKVENLLKFKSPSPAECFVGITKLLSEARNMLSDGLLKPDKVDKELGIPDHIEDLLSTTHSFSKVGVDSTADDPDYSVEAISNPEDSKPQAQKLEPEPAAKTGSETLPLGTLQNLMEEIRLLRKKVLTLTLDNQKLTKELQTLKDKLKS